MDSDGEVLLSVTFQQAQDLIDGGYARGYGRRRIRWLVAVQGLAAIRAFLRRAIRDNVPLAEANRTVWRCLPQTWEHRRDICRSYGPAGRLLPSVDIEY